MIQKLNVENLTIPKEMLDMLEEGTLKLVCSVTCVAVLIYKLQHEENGPSLEAGKESTLASQIQRRYSQNLRGIYNNQDEMIREKIDQDKEQSGEYLKEICQRHKITCLYTYICKTKSGAVYCLLQFNSNPAQVIRSKGDTLEEARSNATVQGLDFLFNMINPVALRDVIP